MARRSVVSFLACSAVLTWGAAAAAHVRFVDPQPRHATPMNAGSSARIKTGPCGCSAMECPNGDVRDPARVTVFEPGETIMVEFAETVQHPGFYRISFDADGQDAFVPPPLARSSIQMGTPTLPVLKDNIPDTSASSYTVSVTLPNMECENCTLQLIQVMTSAMTWQEDDIYYTCADIALRGGGGAGGMGAGGMSAGGMSAGGMAGGGMSAGGMAGGGMSAGGMGAGGMSAGASGTSGAGGMGSGGLSSGGAGAGGAGGMGAPGGAGMASAATGGTAAGMPGMAGGPSAGAPATGGTTGGVGAGAAGGTAPVTAPEEEASCGCRTAPRSNGLGWLVLGAGVVATALTRRRRRVA